MGNNILLEYMNKSLETKKEVFVPGPVITISREFGCYASNLAAKLALEISKETSHKWNFITKEVLEDAAEELHVRVQEIAHIFGANEKSFLGDLITSFAKKKYASDSHIKKTITDVVSKYADQGHCIIVGRAGCVIAKNIKKSLHIRIIAPFEFRVAEIQNAFKLYREDAERLVSETDKQREVFMRFFKGNEPEANLFDVIYNKSKLNEDVIVKSIIQLAKQKELF